MADIEMTDNFKGDDEKLVSCIRALVQLDDSGSLTSPLGGHARTMLEAACLRLAALIAENEGKVSVDTTVYIAEELSVRIAALELERDQLRAESEARRIQVDTLTEWYANALSVIAECTAALPGVTYMDPPDGGDVSVPVQLRRMAKDAERYRHYRMGFVDPEKVDRDIDAAMSKGGQVNG